MIAHALQGSGLSAGAGGRHRDRRHRRRLRHHLSRSYGGSPGLRPLFGLKIERLPDRPCRSARQAAQPTISLRGAYRRRLKALYDAHGRARLSRLECDHAAPPRGEGGDGACLGDRRQSVLGSCRGPRGAAAGRGRPRHRRRQPSVRRPQNVVFTSGGTEANALALTPGLRRGGAAGRAAAGLGDRACLGAVRRAVSGGCDPDHRRHALRRRRSRSSARVARRRATGAGLGHAGQQRDRRDPAGRRGGRDRP